MSIIFDARYDNKYGMMPFLRKPPNAVLYVNTHRGDLNTVHLDRMLGRISGACEEIRRIVAERKPERVGTFGYSLAAFPALHAGAELEADVVVALAPETLIGMPGSRSAAKLKNLPTTFPFPDMRVTFADRAPAATHIYVGEESHTDMRTALRMPTCPASTSTAFALWVTT